MKNAFVYLGKDERIKEETAKHGERLSQAYFELLGRERYDSLVRVNNEVLTPGCYFENVEQMRKVGIEFGQNEASKFIMAGLDRNVLKIDKNSQEATIAPVFFVSQDTFRNSGARVYTDNPIASYVHEFNHYLGFALQKAPMYIAGMMAVEKVGKQIRGIDGLVDHINGVLTSPITADEKREKIVFGLVQSCFEQSYEQMNRILDKKVLGSIGIEAKSGERGKPKAFMLAQIPGIGNFGIPVGGDFYHGITDQQALDKFLKWEDYFNFRGLALGIGSQKIAEEITEMMNISKKMKVKRITFDEMIKMDGEAK